MDYRAMTKTSGLYIVRDLDDSIWREFVACHPTGNIFSTPEMFQVFARTQGYKPDLWAAVDGDHRPLALFLPVRINLSDGLLRRFTSRAVAYGSVLCAPRSGGEEALEVLLKTYKEEAKKQVLFTELRNLSDLSSLQPVLGRYGFAYEGHLNFLVNLTRPPEEIWHSIHSNARRNINKARKTQTVVEEVNDASQVPVVYSLLKEVYKRLQVPLAGLSLFQSAFDVLYPKGMMKILVARADDINIGALTLLLYKGTITYWYTGVLRSYSSHRAADILVWHTLEWGSQNGFRYLDFGGAGKPEEDYGVRDFKAKFGGELVNYGRNVCVHSPAIFQISKTAYQIVRGFIYGR